MLRLARGFASSVSLLASLVAVGCGGAPAVPAPVAPAASAPVEAEARAGRGTSARFVENDLPGAMKKARGEGKLLFVDAWAPWCHTCLSMKSFVLGDPSLGKLEDRVVFASIDTDQPASAAFLEKHSVKAWPTFFVLDPVRDEVVGYWVGSGSVGEMRTLVEEALLAGRPGQAASPEVAAFRTARAEHANGHLDKAAAAYEQALKIAPPAFPHRGAALVGWMEALAGGGGAPDRCVAVGREHLAEVTGSSAPFDFASYLLTCAGKLPAGPEQAAARAAVVAHLTKLTSQPPPDASVDDRQDGLDVLAEALEATGDAAGAKRTQETRLALLEDAARGAPSPDVAQVFDYARANAYVALGQPEKAVSMLEARERELAGNYEPPARLADVLFKMGRYKDALAAVDRALRLAYGPRKLRYLKLRADILGKLGDRAGALATLRSEVAGQEALPPGQANEGRLADAKRRLAEAEKAR